MSFAAALVEHLLRQLAGCVGEGGQIRRLTQDSQLPGR